MKWARKSIVSKPSRTYIHEIPPNGAVVLITRGIIGGAIYRRLHLRTTWSAFFRGFHAQCTDLTCALGVGKLLL